MGEREWDGDEDRNWQFLRVEGVFERGETGERNAGILEWGSMLRVKVVGTKCETDRRLCKRKSNESEKAVQGVEVERASICCRWRVWSKIAGL